MAEKIVSIKSGVVKTSESGKDWIELTDQEDKKHRVFASIKDGEGNWVHLEDEIAMLKGKILDGSIEGTALKITKDKVGQYYNVVKVELVKDVMVKEALKQVEEGPAPQERGMWYKEVGEMYRAGIIKKDTLEGKTLMASYWTRMFIVLNIERKKIGDPPEDIPY